MPLTTISAIPAAPSRLAGPEDFFIDALAFLNAQTGLASQCNAVRGYLNGVNFNLFDWGALTPIGEEPTIPAFSVLPVAPNAATTKGKALASALDEYFAILADFPEGANNVAAFIDNLADPEAETDENPSRPVISAVTDPPVRNDSSEIFESRSASYYNSLRGFSQGLQRLANYANAFGGGLEDWGLITASHTSGDDWGSIA
jgi:hypothetical protein